MEIVDQICDLGWQGVVGNTDEMPFKPESLEEFFKPSPAIRRVEYDVDRNLKLLPVPVFRTDWAAKILESASPRMP